MSIETQLIEEAEAVYYGATKQRPQYEWEGHYLGVSSLVKLGAAEYAERIIAEKPEEQRREDALWSYIGDNLANPVLSAMTPHREVQVRVSLAHGWDIVGHLDGLKIVGDSHFGPSDYVVLEHKARAFVDAEKDEQAERQAILYLSLVELRQTRQERFSLPLAPYSTDPEAQPAFIDPNHRPWGICTLICPRNGPDSITPEARQVRPRKVEAWERAQILDFYTRKAMKILESVETKNLDAARSWDESPEGILEHAVSMTAIQAGLPPTFEPYVLSAVSAKSARDKWDAQARTDEALACAMLAERTLRSVIVCREDGTEAGRATMVGGNGRRNYIRWTPRGEK